MNSITEAFDPHTNYLSPKASDLFKQGMSLSLEGIGAQLQTENDFTKVAKIIPGGPADKSGLLLANDLITGVAQGKADQRTKRNHCATSNTFCENRGDRGFKRDFHCS
jgi:carboxyl-terminal processing protease